MKTFLEIIRDSIYSIVFHLAPRFANVLLFILIGRQIGAFEAGVFTLATTYLLIFATFTKGLDDLLVREVARLENERAASYFINFLLIRVVLALGLQALLIGLVFTLFNYSPDTTQTILILSFSLIPDSITYVAQSILLGHRRYQSSAVILGTASGLKLLGGGMVILTGGGIMTVAWVLVAGSLFAMLCMLILAYREVRPITRQDWMNWQPLRKHWRAAFSFVAITLLTTLETQTDTILLSIFRSELEVGWYGAATTVAYSLVMFSQAYRYAIYPLMSRYALQSPEKMQQLYWQSLRILGILVLPMIAGLVITAPSLVAFVFGPEFFPTVTILRIISFTLLFMFLNEPTVRVLLVYNHQSQIFTFLLVSAALNVGLNLILIPLWGADGAAVARVSSALALFVMSYVFIQRHIMRSPLAAILQKPLLATLVMSAILWSLQELSLFIVVLVGILTYGLCLIAFKEITKEEIAFFQRS